MQYNLCSQFLESTVTKQQRQNKTIETEQLFNTWKITNLQKHVRQTNKVYI